MRLGPLELDPNGYTVSREGETLDLTPTEFKILALLMRRPGQAFHAGPDLRGRLDGVALSGEPLHRRPHQQAAGPRSSTTLRGRRSYRPSRASVTGPPGRSRPVEESMGKRDAEGGSRRP